MPQRYQPDAEVLQEMVDYDSNTTKREVPKGLDVFAAMGVSAAEKILMDELNEPDRWSKYTSNLKRMKKRMNEIKWEENAATQWMSALKSHRQAPACTLFHALARMGQEIAECDAGLMDRTEA